MIVSMFQSIESVDDSCFVEVGDVVEERPDQCGVEDCTLPRLAGETLCIEHERTSHIEALTAEVEERYAEERAVRAAGQDGWRQVDVHGSIAREIVGELKKADQPLGKLRLHIEISHDAIMAYSLALVEAKLATFVRLWPEPVLSAVVEDRPSFNRILNLGE